MGSWTLSLEGVDKMSLCEACPAKHARGPAVHAGGSGGREGGRAGQGRPSPGVSGFACSLFPAGVTSGRGMRTESAGSRPAVLLHARGSPSLLSALSPAHRCGFLLPLLRPRRPRAQRAGAGCRSQPRPEAPVSSQVPGRMVGRAGNMGFDRDEIRQAGTCCRTQVRTRGVGTVGPTLT